MTPRMRWPALVARTAAMLLALPYAGGGPTSRAAEPASEEFFETQVRPVLAGTCFRCHGGQKVSGSLRTDSREALLAGGDSGPAFIAGNSAESLLVRAVQHADDVSAMPPDGKLDAAQIAALENWIEAGAPWPATTARFEVAAHWAFEPVQPVVISGLDENVPLHEGIDALIAARLDAAEVLPAPPADRRTLIRRATYDLTGLPPTTEEIVAFEQDTSPQAFATVVDRLLESPAYGEQWGRHWLDVVRYADTAGENTDHPLPHAWRYRNWVISALQRDVPYDEFVRRQIAGDLLASQRPAEEYADHVVATGFLALARRFGHDIEKDMHLTMEDVIDTLGKSVLGLTIGCARCHDHKYDPVTARDYYGLYGIFESTRFPFPGCEPKQQPRDLVPMLAPAEIARHVQPIEADIARIDSELAQLNESARIQSRELQAVADKSARVLAGADLDDGASHDLASHARLPLEAIEVAAGDVLLLTIAPRGDHGADSTLVDLTIREIGGQERRWSAIDLVADLPTANPHPDRFGHASTWCFLDAADGYVLLPRALDAINGRTELKAWNNGDTPSVFVNTSVESVSVWTNLPAQSFFMHPGPNGPVALAWLSPLTGTVALTGKISDAHPSGDGIRWSLTHGSSPELATQFASLPQGNAAAEKLQSQREELTAQLNVPVAFAVAEGSAHNVQLHERGDPAQLGEEVPRKFPDLLGGQVVDSGSGRLDLAHWLTDPTNPLTARVIANRVWQWHFGQPLVATPNDFGTRGALPTHPELLDYLAGELMAHGWSLHWLHREIMASETYQRSGRRQAAVGAAPAEPATIELYDAFPLRRLTAEELRDTLLFVSGELDDSPGEAHPFPAESTWSFTQHAPFAAEYPTAKRSIYQLQKRNRRDRFFALFDGPDPNATTPLREATTVPTQALYFLNDATLHAQAERLSSHVVARVENDGARLDELYRRLFARSADETDRAAAQEFLAAYRESLGDQPESERTRRAWSAYIRVLLSSNEFLYID